VTTVEVLSRERRWRDLYWIGSTGIAGLAVVVLVSSLLVSWKGGVGRIHPAELGVPAAAAECGQVLVDPPSPKGIHVGPGTDRPAETRIRYATVPPSSGPHYLVPASSNRRFYTESDRPTMEQLVHNLEHGYTVVWYDATLGPDHLRALRDLVLVRGTHTEGHKFLVSPWDSTYGTFPPGVHVAAATWGHRLLCAAVSGEALDAFATRFPPALAPEPDGP
jgi:hypothetical protein